MKKKRRIWAEKNPEKTIFPFHLLVAQGGFFFLFHSLLIILLLYPFLETTGEDKNPWTLILTSSAVVTGIVYTVSFNWRQLAFALCLELPIFVLYASGTPPAQKLAIALTIILYIYVIFLIIPFLLHAKKVDAEDIYAVISAYILIGMAWSSLFHLTELIYPGSFYVSASQNIDNILSWSDFIFFSFVTLTTLGYGDITPVTSHARSLAIIESITGVMFLGTLVARSIGLYVFESLREQTEDSSKD